MTAFHMIDSNRRIRRAERAAKHAELLKAHKTYRANLEKAAAAIEDLDVDLLESLDYDEDDNEDLVRAAAELGIDLTVGP